MTLGELIEFLEKQDPALTLPEGFANPHSYRGYYDELAFEPAQDVTVASMLDAARSALGRTFHGWKGGEYVMSEHTDCWLAIEGCCGEGIGPVLLRLMIGGARLRGQIQAVREIAQHSAPAGVRPQYASREALLARAVLDQLDPE